MIIRQVTAFLENKVGMLQKFAAVMEAAGFGVVGMCVADTTDFGILRVITPKPQECVAHLRASGFTANTTSVIAVALNEYDRGMEAIFDALTQNNISIEYLYSLARRVNKNAVVIFKVSDIHLACQALGAKGVKLLSEEELAL